MNPQPAQRWDIFCNVIDNYGDIGVAWRLARQLAHEHGQQVRLWVDDLHAFARICPEVRADIEAGDVAGTVAETAQQVHSITVQHWQKVLDPASLNATPWPQVVVELFGCHLPEAYENWLAQAPMVPMWINLEYLSAELWVEGCHGLPSQHPRLPLSKTFFYPGFTPRTGGLLREATLLATRDEFWAQRVAAGVAANTVAQQIATHATASVQIEQLHDAHPVFSLFCYAGAAVQAWLNTLAQSTTPCCVRVPQGVAAAEVRAVCAAYGHTAPAVGEQVRCGALTLQVQAFVPQAAFDAQLWACDLNVVRGEDSFVRAQWAGLPMLWHIYPQQDGVHLQKLDAWLALYLADAPPALANAVASLMRVWNALGGDTAEETTITTTTATTSTTTALSEAWQAVLPLLPAWRDHALHWANTLAKQPDLATQLMRHVSTRATLPNA